MIRSSRSRIAACVIALSSVLAGTIAIQRAPFSTTFSTTARAARPSPHDAETPPSPRTTWSDLKATGAMQSAYRKQGAPPSQLDAPAADLKTYRRVVAPVLREACFHCHGADFEEGGVRIDRLDPDLLQGDDVDWWLEVLAVLTNGEMPPPDEGELADDDRARIVEWLSQEIQVASTFRRAERDHSSFRRLTRYEYNYALQDLLGLPYDFAKDLPPESPSEDGFQNSSEMLQISSDQLATYRRLGRQALQRATVRGQQPKTRYWSVTMEAASAARWKEQDNQLAEVRQKHQDDPSKLNREIERLQAEFRKIPRGAYYKALGAGRSARVTWSYPGARYAHKPTTERVEAPLQFDHVAVIPPRQTLIIELGDQIPDEGTLRIRFRASRTSLEDDRLPSLQLEFGWQSSNDSAASVRISDHDLAIDAAPDQPRFYQWEIPLSEVAPRNSMRGRWKLGGLPNPSEYLKFVNSSISGGDVQLDYVEVMAPVYDQWPPDSHARIFVDSDRRTDETSYAREIVSRFMARAWRRPVADAEVDQKLGEVPSYPAGVDEPELEAVDPESVDYIAWVGLSSTDPDFDTTTLFDFMDRRMRPV
ncbi:MAG: DUF1587 domain-containing protein, partial [Planctomycetota bacterium]